jgi:hypothetical protein
LPVGQLHRRKRSVFSGRILEHVVAYVSARASESNKKPTAGLAAGCSEIAVNELKPDCHAAQQQRVRKQQVQVSIHVGDASKRLAELSMGLSRGALLRPLTAAAAEILWADEVEQGSPFYIREVIGAVVSWRGSIRL